MGKLNKIVANWKALLHDTGGNVMWIVALSIFPMIAIVGSGADIARYYAAQSRLQQACDAGVLAARKSMANSGSLNAVAKAQGKRMFDFNFPAKIYDSSNTTFETQPVNSTEISATASTSMPPIIMRIFNFENKQLNVSCGSRLEIANVDIVFVLDTTGSMALNNRGDTQSRMIGMQNAVMSFFDTMMQARTPTSRIRMGFVPFSQNVNVGKLLVAEDSSWIADSATYQSRRKSTATTTSGRYDYMPLTSPDLSSYKKGGTLSAPIGIGGANVTIPAWTGCIEELPTVAFSSGSAPIEAHDLDLKFVPSGTDVWKPHIPRMTYTRMIDDFADNPQFQNSINTSNTNVNSFQDALNNPSNATLAGCPSEARRLQEVKSTDRAAINTYITGLKAQGGTYLDIGMIWGGRWIAPVGIFAGDNTALPANGLPQARHIIFMTDGNTDTLPRRYTAYGVEAMDQRVTGGSGSTNVSTMDARHDTRFLAACEAAKTDGQSTLWVISFGDDSDLNANLKSCATPGLAFKADDSDELQKRFKEIAQRITFLRLSQ